MDMDDLVTVAEKATLTPAERGVLAEQAQAVSVQLDVFIGHCKEGTAAEVIKDFIPVLRGTEYVNAILTRKIGEAIENGTAR